MLRACTPSPQKALSIIWSMFDLTRLFADLESQKRLLGQPFTELKRSLLIEHFAVTANDLKRYSRSRFSPASCGCGLPQKREQNFVRFKNTEKKPQAFGLVAFLSRDRIPSHASFGCVVSLRGVFHIRCCQQDITFFLIRELTISIFDSPNFGDSSLAHR